MDLPPIHQNKQLNKRRKTGTKWQKRKNYYQKKKRKTKLGRVEGIIATVLVVAAAIAYFIYDHLPAQPLPGDGVSVHFIDVGQGDSTLIQYDGNNICIDAGKLPWNVVWITGIEEW